ncbi:MAG: EAL domain-containing protein, partial [Hyphomicrobiales bacterium]
VEASINLGKQLDLRLVAEGVETAEDWDYVASAGIDEVQGYYVARPMPADELAGWAVDFEARVQASAPKRGIDAMAEAALRA